MRVCNEDLRDSQEEISDEEYRVSAASKRRLYRFQLKKRLSTVEHMNYTKFVIDLVNVDVDIEEEDKASILLNSLPDEEYGTILTLINGKQLLNYNNVSAAFINYEVRRKDKQSSSSSTSVEALVVRGRGSHQKGKGIRGRSKSRSEFRDLKKISVLFAKS